MPFRIKTYAHSNRNQNQVQIEPKLIRIKVCAHSNQTYAHQNQTYAHRNQSLHPFKSEKSTLLSPQSPVKDLLGERNLTRPKDSHGHTRSSQVPPKPFPSQKPKQKSAPDFQGARRRGQIRTLFFMRKMFMGCPTSFSTPETSSQDKLRTSPQPLFIRRSAIGCFSNFRTFIDLSGCFAGLWTIKTAIAHLLA